MNSGWQRLRFHIYLYIKYLIFPKNINKIFKDAFESHLGYDKGLGQNYENQNLQRWIKEK